MTNNPPLSCVVLSKLSIAVNFETHLTETEFVKITVLDHEKTHGYVAKHKSRALPVATVVSRWPVDPQHRIQGRGICVYVVLFVLFVSCLFVCVNVLCVSCCVCLYVRFFL